MRHAVTSLVALALLATSSACVARDAFACTLDVECSANERCASGVCAVGAREGEGEGGCPDENAKALIVTVTSPDVDVAVCDAVVTVSGADGASIPLTRIVAASGCTFEDPPLSAHDVPLTGELTVSVAAFNHTGAAVAVFVPEDGCGVVTQRVSLTVHAIDGTCDADSACSAGVVSGLCTVDRVAQSATCASAGVRDEGQGCASDAVCLHGLCDGGLCSRLCTKDAECASSQRCISDDALSGALVCAVRTDLPVTACDRDADCEATGRICAHVDVGGLFCRLPTASTADVGAVCHDEGESEACATGVCDDAADGRCTVACVNDGDCPVAPGQGAAQSKCTAIGIDGVDARACFAECTAVSDCDDGTAQRSCRARVDVVENAVVFACDGARGQGAVGDDVTDGAACATNFSLSDLALGTYCSAPCVDDADCAANMHCALATLNRPNGDTQKVDACLR